jgi:hypothetical protein
MLKPLRTNVFATLIDKYGYTSTTGGLIFEEKNSDIKPRWFKVTHVGPKQDDVKPGNYILVAHGRWSRGLDVFNTNNSDEFLFNIDIDAILGFSTSH